jgi:hypothetical protein
MALRRDWIHRMIEQLAAALARIVGLRQAGRLDEARGEIERAAGGIAGVDLRMLEAVDSAQAAALVRDPDRVAALARLALERAEIEAASGDAARERAWRRRAVELGLEAALAGAPIDAEVRAAALAGPDDAVAPRYREVRARVLRGNG